MKLQIKLRTTGKLRGGISPNEEEGYLNWLSQKLGKNIFETQKLIERGQKNKSNATPQTIEGVFDEIFYSPSVTFRMNQNGQCCLAGHQIKGVLADGNMVLMEKPKDSLKTIIHRGIYVEPLLIPVGDPKDLKIETKFEKPKGRDAHIARRHYFDPPIDIIFNLATQSPRLSSQVIRRLFEAASGVGGLTDEGRTPYEVVEFNEIA